MPRTEIPVTSKNQLLPTQTYINKKIYNIKINLNAFMKEIQSLTMKASGIKSHLTNPILRNEILLKLPPTVQMSWVAYKN